jgi:hypothetical protein
MTAFLEGCKIWIPDKVGLMDTKIEEAINIDITPI